MMKGMRSTLEKTAILGLSLMLVSTYSVTAALPGMKETFSAVNPALVEMLLSVTSLAIMCTIILDIFLHHLFSERLSITLGLVLVSFAGTVPLWCQSFVPLFFSRIALGIGLGLTNSYAITLIQGRYQGTEQAFLLGVRGAMETLGGALLTLLAGLLLSRGWRQAFWIYLAALPILLLFLLFVPKHQTQTQQRSHAVWTPSSLRFLVSGMLFGALCIFVNTSNTMRIPEYLIENQLGSARDASVVLSLLQAVGVVGGIFYGKLKGLMKDFMFPVTLLVFALGDLLFACSSNLAMVSIGAVCSGYGNGLLATILFNRVSETLPEESVSLGTHIVLVGCNLGATSTPLVMQLLGRINPSNTFLFVVYAAALAILGLVEFGKQKSA